MYNIFRVAGESNGCQGNMGNCAQLCIPLPNNAIQCACTAGYELSKEDNISCRGRLLDVNPFSVQDFVVCFFTVGFT